jgi:serine/threonine protein kinase
MWGLAGFAKDFINDPRAGKIVGTTDYISPEQIRTPLEVNSASDIYSLGCTLYYAVCGKVPFPGGDTTSKLRRHLEETPWHPRQFAIDITEDFVDIIADMMEKDVTKRIANAAEVAARLEPWVSDNLSLGGMPMTRSPWMAPPLPSSLRLDSFDEREPGVGDGGTGETLRSGELTQSTSANTGAGRTGAGSSEAIAVSNQNLLAPPVIDSQAADLFPYSGLSDSSKMPLPEFASTGSASSIIGSKPASSPAPSIAAVTSTVPSSDGRLSSSMVIALTLAIAIPPALLLGAILGYLAAR